jgi:hypothetical protein
MKIKTDTLVGATVLTPSLVMSFILSDFIISYFFKGIPTFHKALMDITLMILLTEQLSVL